MELVVISAPEAVKDEIGIISRFFELGLQRFHLRRPLFSASDTEVWLKQLPGKYHHKVVLHAHHYLAGKYEVGGIHFTKKHFQGKNPGMKHFNRSVLPKNVKTVSASFHSLSEVSENRENYDYLFLSPVFNSITKENYPGGFEPAALKIFLKQYKKERSALNKAKIIALGGMKAENIQLAFKTGFDGAAFLGALWSLEGEENIMGSFYRLKQGCEEIIKAAI